MTTSTPATGELRLALDAIRLRENVRELDNAHVETLAQSIALRGLLVPLIVQPVDEGYELVAGYHRMAACRKLDLPDAPVVVRDKEGLSADSAAENVTSCRRRHDVINADRVVMPMSELKCPTVRCEPGGEVGIRPRSDPGSQTAADDRLKWGLPLDSEASAPPAAGLASVSAGSDPERCFKPRSDSRSRAGPACRRSFTRQAQGAPPPASFGERAASRESDGKGRPGTL